MLKLAMTYERWLSCFFELILLNRHRSTRNWMINLQKRKWLFYEHIYYSVKTCRTDWSWWIYFWKWLTLTKNGVNIIKKRLWRKIQPCSISDWTNWLAHFMPLVSLDTPWKHQKTKGFLMFSEGIESDQWHEMG